MSVPAGEEHPPYSDFIQPGKKSLQSMDILCIIISIVKQEAKGPAYFGMQALSMLEVLVMMWH